MLKLLICCLLAFASALELPAVSRRALLSRVAAAVPLAAIAQQASAERPSNAVGTSVDGKSAVWMTSSSSNTVLGVGKYTKTGFEPEVVSKPIGRADSLIDEWGSAAAEGKAKSAASTIGAIGSQPKNEVAFARLLK